MSGAWRVVVVLLAGCGAGAPDGQATVEPPEGGWEIPLASRSVSVPPGVADSDRATILDQAAARGDDRAHALVQLWRLPDRDERQLLADAGLQLQGFVSANTYIALVHQAALQRSLPSPVRSVVALHVDDRWASAVPQVGSAKALVIAHADDQLEVLADRLVRRGLRVDGSLAISHGLLVSGPMELLRQAAVEDQLIAVLPRTTDAKLLLDDVRQDSSTSWAHLAGVTGSTQTVAIQEFASGYWAHQDFQDADGEPRIVASDWDIPARDDACFDDFVNHAMHVAGIAAGGGHRSDGLFTGIAPDASIVTRAADGRLDDFNSRVEADWSAAGALGAVVVNNSWGIDAANAAACDEDTSDNLGVYSVVSAASDRLARAGVTVVFGAGNGRRGGGGGCASEDDGIDCGTPDQPWSNWNTTSSTATGKNTIIVGATSKHDEGRSTGHVTDYSGWGPLGDGRLSPTVVAIGGAPAFGEGIERCAGRVTAPVFSDTGYCAGFDEDRKYAEYQGTSMAAPFVTGVVGLMADAHDARLPAGSALLPAHYRALLAHTAEDNHGRTQIDDTGPIVSAGLIGPDYQTGYGDVNAFAAVAQVAQGLYSQGTLSAGTARPAPGLHSFTVPEGTASVKVTMAWDDHPASYPRTSESTLVNQLSVQLIDPSGNRHAAWRLDPDRPDLAATRHAVSFTPVDTLQQVYVDEDVEPGEWQVQVRGVLALDSGQTYALVADFHLDDADGDSFARFEDCDDTDPSIHPGATDASGDGIDQDCDGIDGAPFDCDGFDVPAEYDTIADAVEAANAAGGTVCIAAGSYDEAAILVTGDDVHIVGEGVDLVTVTGDGDGWGVMNFDAASTGSSLTGLTLVNEPDGIDTALLLGAPDVLVYDVALVGNSNSYTLYVADGDFIEVRNVRITGGDFGVVVTGSNALLDALWISATETAGVYVVDGSEPTLQNSFIVDNAYIGVAADETDPILVNNTIADNAGAGLYVFNDAYPLSANDFYYNNDYSILCATWNYAEVSYSLQEDNSSSCIMIGLLSTATGALDADYRITADSELIDAGRAGEAPDHDYDGDERPLDGDGDGTARADVGADEYVP